MGEKGKEKATEQETEKQEQRQAEQQSIERAAHETGEVVQHVTTEPAEDVEASERQLSSTSPTVSSKAARASASVSPTIPEEDEHDLEREGGGDGGQGEGEGEAEVEGGSGGSTAEVGEGSPATSSSSSKTPTSSSEKDGEAGLSATARKNRLKKLRQKEAKERKRREEEEARKKQQEEEEQRAVAAAVAATEQGRSKSPALAKSPSHKKEKGRRKFSLTSQVDAAASSSPGSPVNGSASAAYQRTFASSSSASSSLLYVLILITTGSMLFAVTRSYLGAVLYDGVHDFVGSSQNIWSLIASLYLGSLFFFVWLFRCAYEELNVWSALVLEISNQLDKYVISWELLAVADPAQLLAAIGQTSHLLDAIVASFAGLSGTRDAAITASAKAAISHAEHILDFLHLAHRNLIAELGSTQPIMRLVASLGSVRTKVMQVRARVRGGGNRNRTDATLTGPAPTAANRKHQQPHAEDTASTPLSALALLLLCVQALNVAVLLFSPPLSNTLLNVLLPLGLLYVLSSLLTLLWGAQYPFAAPPGASAFPSSLLQRLGCDMCVSLEPLHYLRHRLTIKAEETKTRQMEMEMEMEMGMEMEEEDGTATEGEQQNNSSTQHSTRLRLQHHEPHQGFDGEDMD